MPRDENRSGLGEIAYRRLRIGLISCVLPPGQRINISRLQKELAVSQAAMREALSRLCADGLVTAEFNVGFKASSVMPGGYRQLAEACAMIEDPCLRSAIQHGDARWMEHLHAVYQAALRAVPWERTEPVALEQYAAWRESFHLALFSACTNQWLVSAWHTLYAQHMRYRQWFSRLAKFESELFDDYSEFMDAVTVRDEDRALDLWNANHRKVIAFIEMNEETQKSAESASKRRTPRRRPDNPAPEPLPPLERSVDKGYRTWPSNGIVPYP